MLGRKGSQNSDIGEEEDLESEELDDAAEAGDNEDLEDFDDDDEVWYDFITLIYTYIYIYIILHTIYDYIYFVSSPDVFDTKQGCPSRN